ncbi:MAG: hypothetical protein ACRDAP_05465 [Shewanella sp.]
MTMQERSSLLSGREESSFDGEALLERTASLSTLNFAKPKNSSTRASLRSSNSAAGAYAADDSQIATPFTIIPPLKWASEEDLGNVPPQRTAVMPGVFERSKGFRSQTDLEIEMAARNQAFKEDLEFNEARLKELAEELEKRKKEKEKKGS